MARSSRCFLYDVLSVAMPSSYAWEASLLLVVCWLRRVTSSKLFANKMSDSKTLSKPKITKEQNTKRKPRAPRPGRRPRARVGPVLLNHATQASRAV